MSVPPLLSGPSRDRVRDVLHRVVTGHDAGAVRELARLLRAHGEERVARIQHEVGIVDGVRDWRATTALACGLADVGRMVHLLVEDGESSHQAGTLARTVSRYAGWLLLAAIDADRSAGTGDPASAWGAALGALADGPWSPDPQGLDAQIGAWADDRVVLALDELRWASQEREAGRERSAVAAEIRRVVDESGLSQRAFAQRIGTSASRLSTYLNGRVTPSATMMLRVKRLERALRAPVTRAGVPGAVAHAS